MTTTYVASDLNRDVSERGDAVAAGQPQLVGCPVPTGHGMDVIIPQRIIEAVARRVSTACTWERRCGERGAKPGCALLVSARSQRPARGRARAWGHQWTFSPGRPRRRSPADRSSQLGATAASGCLMSDDLAAKQSSCKSRPARDKLDFLACDRFSNHDRPIGGRVRPIVPLHHIRAWLRARPMHAWRCMHAGGAPRPRETWPPGRRASSSGTGSTCSASNSYKSS